VLRAPESNVGVAGAECVQARHDAVGPLAPAGLPGEESRVRAGQADVGGRRGKVAMKASSDRT
jgi:hypothetical protein